jgi:glycine/D-amino acid oxidase-like deaminating enzyme/nitrite reductase/ring-hydroxylating ferredoxin subunit
MHTSPYNDESVWSPPFESNAPISEEPIEVCIVGAGIAGLSVAYRLAKEGIPVLVLDSKAVGGGQTNRTTAHLASAIDDRFVEMERIHGREFSRLAAQSHAAAIEFIEQVVSDEFIDCDFERLNGFLFSPPDHSDSVIRAEYAAARRAGLDVELLNRAPLPDFDTGTCLCFARQGQFDPMRYLQGLARAITRLGGKIVTGMHVISAEGGRSAKVTTVDGHTIRPRHIVVATNTPINDLLAIHTKQAAYLSYVVALEIDPSSYPGGLFWDTDDPYHYVRLARTDEGSCLIVGGEDHKTGQGSDFENRFQRLEQWARQRFPQAGPRRQQWSGQVMETMDGLGFIGRNPADWDNVYVATGDSGMGMTHGTIAGMLIGDLILGRPNPWEEVYSPARKRLKAVGQFLKENINSALQYVSHLTPGDVSTVDHIQPGTGAVVRQGLSKCAAYRDENGELHVYSAVCPHLNAIVVWNQEERTWDCPAHGSRFDCDGKVIQGPANVDLQPQEVTAGRAV